MRPAIVPLEVIRQVRQYVVDCHCACLRQAFQCLWLLDAEHRLWRLSVMFQTGSVRKLLLPSVVIHSRRYRLALPLENRVCA